MVSLVSHDDQEDLLTRRGHHDIAVIPGYKGRTYCGETEEIVDRKSISNDLVEVCYQFPDGKEEKVFVKMDPYEGITTLGITLPDENRGESFFKRGAVYLPVGHTLDWIHRMYNSGIRKVIYPVNDKDRVAHIWAYTRNTTYAPENWENVKKFDQRVSQVEAKHLDNDSGKKIMIVEEIL